jgi:hypothetical protein
VKKVNLSYELDTKSVLTIYRPSQYLSGLNKEEYT